MMPGSKYRPTGRPNGRPRKTDIDMYHRIMDSGEIPRIKVVPGSAIHTFFEGLAEGINPTNIELPFSPQPGPQTLAFNSKCDELFYGGSRGSGKSFLLLLDFAQHAIKWSVSARGIIFRRQFVDLRDLIDESHKIYPAIGGIYSPNTTTWKFSNGANLRFSYLAKDDDTNKYLGHQFSFIGIEESGTFASFDVIRKLKATLRSSTGVKVRLHLNGNPGGVGHCLVKDTDILTKDRGWVNISNVTTNDYVASLDKDEKFAFLPVEQVHSSDFDGNLFSFRSATATIRCTPNHSICRRTETKTPLGRQFHGISLVAAEDLSQVTRTIRSARGGWAGEEIKSVKIDPIVDKRNSNRIIQTLEISGDDYCELAGWMVSEGYTHINRSYYFGICQTKPNNRLIIKELLARCGFSFSEVEFALIVRSREWANHWREVAGAGCREKKIPRLVLGASQRQLDIFWRAAMLGDGCGTTYYTISKDLADGMMEVGMKLGYAMRLRSRQKAGRNGLCYEVNFRDGRDGWLERKLAVNEPYSGPVYCLGIPGVHRFFVRQGGSVWLSGNSWLKMRYVTAAPPFTTVVTRQCLHCNKEFQILNEQDQTRVCSDKCATAVADKIGDKSLPSDVPWSRVFIPARVEDNKILMANDPGYVNRIKQSGPEWLVKAWLEGDWNIVAGGMFDDLFYPSVYDCSIVVPKFKIPSDWPIERGFDWGTAHPFSVCWFTESDGTPVWSLDGTRELYFPRGSKIVVGEWYGAHPDRAEHANEGIHMVAQDIAIGILDRELSMFGRHCYTGVADSAISIGSGTRSRSIQAEMASAGVHWQLCVKGPNSRVNGWNVMRERFQAAARNTGKPGLYICDNCTDCLRTIPALPRDQKKLDDVDSASEDHCADCIRYVLVTPPYTYSTGHVSELWGVSQ